MEIIGFVRVVTDDNGLPLANISISLILSNQSSQLTQFGKLTDEFGIFSIPLSITSITAIFDQALNVQHHIG